MGQRLDRVAQTRIDQLERTRSRVQAEVARVVFLEAVVNLLDVDDCKSLLQVFV